MNRRNPFLQKAALVAALAAAAAPSAVTAQSAVAQSTLAQSTLAQSTLAQSAAQSAVAQQRFCNWAGQPFKASFDFTEVLDPSIQCPGQAPGFAVQGYGTASQLGRIAAASQNCVVPTQTGSVLFFAPNAPAPNIVITAANGDQLYAVYGGVAAPSFSTPASGQYTLVGGYTIVGGTGRLAKASGCGILTGNENLSLTTVPPSGFGQIILNGVISY